MKAKIPSLLHVEFREIMNEQYAAYGMKARVSTVLDPPNDNKALEPPKLKQEVIPDVTE